MEKELAALKAELAEANRNTEFWKNIGRLYEELRDIIDGGSESMTHEDAVKELNALKAELAETNGFLEASRDMVFKLELDFDRLSEALETEKRFTSRYNELQERWDYYQEFCRTHGAHSIGQLVVQRDEAKQELAALKDIARCYEELRSIIDGGSESMTHEDAVEALKAQPAQSEPVAYAIRSYGVMEMMYSDRNEAEFQASEYPIDAKAEVVDLYTTPQPSAEVERLTQLMNIYKDAAEENERDAARWRKAKSLCGIFAGWWQIQIRAIEKSSDCERDFEAAIDEAIDEAMKKGGA